MNMLRLTPEQYRTLANLQRQPDGLALLALLKAGLEEAQVALRTATGERVGWLQGEAQCLAEWVKQFEGAGRLAGR
ncbi:hypothetical protein [Nevskia soli]|uniref:hypothetical protein n=1 Tax=Nevskia soli TaxID=418856 RepID=UPI0012FADA6D|nr:hypothetical protein [Nevskia soli]